jgi:UDP-glucose 4-epimerase
LVTGAAGFIGSHLVERCLSLGWRVTAIDAFTDYYPEERKRRNISAAETDPNYRLIEGDLLDLDLPGLLEDVTVVFHLAAQPGVRNSWDDFALYARYNIDATQRLLHAIRGLPLERVVVASSSSIYGESETLPTAENAPPRPVSPYGVTKVSTEQLARVYWRSFGVPTVCLRYFTVYGPRQRPDMAFSRLISGLLAGEVFEVFGDGEQTRDFTFVTDAVNGTIAAAQSGKPGSEYNIGGGSRISLNSVLDVLDAIAGSPVKRRYVAQQLGDARDTAADIRRARAELGFHPVSDFESGLRAQFDWQRVSFDSPSPAFQQ